MAIHEKRTPEGVVELVMDNPPVNALNISDTLDLATRLASLDSDATARAVVLTATGRGFCAGVDIKEMQDLPSNEGILAVNDACYRAFKAVYECAVPVVVAVNDFCLGTGVGLAGSADIVVASEHATFGLPEVDNGALGAATHLARLVPPQRARHMLYTCETASADELRSYGTVLAVVKPDDLMTTAHGIARAIAAKPPGTIRAAKRSLNGIDPVDVNRSYRFEQGFTFELNLAGEGDRARDAFLRGERDRPPGPSG